tara:strand:- start:19909 stop:20325 length:417 start_codon:yes stop_codon:yes gene_type:complete
MNQAYQTNEASQASKRINEVFILETTQLIQARVQVMDFATRPSPRQKKEQLAFPEPTEHKTEAKAFLCPTDRILAIYNKQLAKTQRKLTCTVKEWFVNTALETGWNEVEFLENPQTGRIDGCMLRVRKVKESSHAQSH